MRKRVGIIFIAVVVLAVAGAVWNRAKQSNVADAQHAEHIRGEGVDAIQEDGGSYASDDARQSYLYSAARLSDAVRTLLGLDGNIHNYKFLKIAISSLPTELSSDDIAALRELLTWKNSRFPEGMKSIQINSVKNDVLARLLCLDALPDEMGMQLVEMASNTDNDPVWRDYCIQFMPHFYERVSAESLEQRAGSVPQASSLPSDEQGLQDAGGTEELNAVREAMFAALDERDSTIAGTSLIGLELLSRTYEEFDHDNIVTKATEIAADERAAPSSRLTALRLAAQVGWNQSTVDTARALAQTGETAMLRSAAIVTLGETGSDEDRELLETFAVSDNRQIAMAAEMALQKMDAR